MKLEKAKLEQKRKYEKKIDGKKGHNINAMLSKLVITKFKGIPTDWLCLTGNFHLRTEITKVNRGVPLTLTNPWYKDILAKYDHLRGVEIDDVDLKRELPVYLILGTRECAKIKTETVPKMGKPGEPIAELTRFGWTLMSPENEPHLIKMFLTQTSKVDYEELCWLDSCAWIRGWSRCRPKPNVRRL